MTELPVIVPRLHMSFGEACEAFGQHVSSRTYNIAIHASTTCRSGFEIMEEDWPQLRFAETP
jgi:hypothetical protein